MIAENLSETFQARASLFRNPLFSLSDLYEPKQIYEIFDFCKRIALSNEVVSAILHKMAESPVTDLLYNHENDEVKGRYQRLFEGNMNIRERLLEILFDLVTYSNAFVSFEVPVTRFLVSPNVSHDLQQKKAELDNGKMSASDFDGWLATQANEPRNTKIPKRFRIETIDWELDGNAKFMGQCPITQKRVTFERIDRYYPSEKNVSLKRWDPNLIEIHYNEITGKSKYYYRMSKSTRELIRTKDRDMFNEVPWPYIDAVFNRRNVRINEDNFRHLSNVRISGAFNGWGVPRLYSAFRAIFYYMTLLRANQSIAVGKIHDLNILYPAMTSSSVGLDPLSAMPGGTFTSRISSILKSHQKDPNYTGVSPLPVGVTSVFGQGRMQLVSNELEPVIRTITTALGLPYDMLYGGGAYTGQAVAQRIFSAQTGLTRDRFNELIQFIVGNVSASLGTTYPKDMDIKLRPVEGPDAVQNRSLIIQMAERGIVSNQTALSQLDIDWKKELTNMEQEASEMKRIQKIRGASEAFVQSRQQEILQRSQRRLDAELQEELAQNEVPGEAPAEEVSHNVNDVVDVYLEYLNNYPNSVGEIMEIARNNHPDAYTELLKYVGAPMESPGIDVPSTEPISPDSLPAQASELLPSRRQGSVM